jgi:hypothetical protein
LKAPQGFFWRGIVINPSHIAIYAVSIGKIRFHRDGCKPLLLNQPFSNLYPLLVELIRSVGCLTNQNEAGIAN